MLHIIIASQQCVMKMLGGQSRVCMDTGHANGFNGKFSGAHEVRGSRRQVCCVCHLTVLLCSPFYETRDPGKASEALRHIGRSNA